MNWHSSEVIGEVMMIEVGKTITGMWKAGIEIDTEIVLKNDDAIYTFKAIKIDGLEVIYRVTRVIEFENSNGNGNK